MNLSQKLKDFHLILGSASPRRKELLAGLDIPFTILVKKTDEQVDASLAKEEIPLAIAEQKFLALEPELKNDDFLITADTLVLCHERIMGKPKTIAEAKEMIQFLSGKTHKVITGVCIGTRERHTLFRDEAHVTFTTISDEDISYYVEKYAPLDKAGAYGVQEWIGYVGIEKIVGSYYTVMGLPVQKLYEEILRF